MTDMFPVENWSVTRCVIVMQQPVHLLPKFEAKSSYIFAQSQNVALVCGIHYFGSQNKFIMNNAFDVIENYEHDLAFAFSVSVSLDIFHCEDCCIVSFAYTFFPERIPNH
jgi:hypothetical protein